MRSGLWLMTTTLLAAAGCATTGDGSLSATVSGEVFYRERIAVPPATQLEVVLEDVSRADAPAEAIGSLVVPDAGNPPYRFEIRYPRDRIVESNRYSVRARLTHGGRLLFSTDIGYPVITGGKPSSGLQLLLRSVPAARAAPEPPGDLPASFIGALPCADCEAIDHQLDLFPDGSFYLRQEYRGKPEGRFDDIGAWMLSSDGKLLVLNGGREAKPRFELKGPDELRLMGQDGEPIVSQLDYSLRRSAKFEPIEPRLTMRGMYVYMADAGLFTECLTGRRMPVAMEADNRALESAYAKVRREPGDSLLAVVDGRIAQRMPMEGPGPVATLIAERFVGIRPGESCETRPASPDLVGTYWKLTRLGDAVVERSANQSEPHVVLHGEDNRLAGSDGCNRLIGGYRTDGGTIDFGQVATTMMACPQGMEQAQRFTTALGATVRYRIVGQFLELFDATDAMLARFEAVALR